MIVIKSFFAVLIVGRIAYEIALALSEDPEKFQRERIHPISNVRSFQIASFLMAGTWFGLLCFLLWR